MPISIPPISVQTHSELPVNTPFKNGKYTGCISVNIKNNFLTAESQRLILTPFTEPFRDKFQATYPDIVERQEFTALEKIFKNKSNLGFYLNGQTNTDQQITNRLNRDSKRALEGNLFTGYAVVDKETDEVIGRAAIGSGDHADESQFGLILRKDYFNNNFGKETALLMAGVATTLFENHYCIESPKNTIPVRRFTATALDRNIPSLHLMKSMKHLQIVPSGFLQKVLYYSGFASVCHYFAKPIGMRSLYEIQGKDFRAAMAENMDITQFSQHVEVK